MSKQEKATMKVMKNAEMPSATSLSAEERKQLSDELQKEIDQRTKEMNTKFYVVEGGAEAGKKFVKFLSEEAQWKFTEAFGIIECVKEINAAIEKAKDGKELFLQILPLEAMWFFINKVEGAGLEKALYYHDSLLKPVGDALGRVKADRDAINQLMMRQGSLDAGADFEKEVQPATAE